MSGEESDGEGSAREKRLIRVPVQWINSELTDMFHTIDTWKSTVNNESMVNPRGNRPLARLPTSKEPAVGTPTRGLPRNWYNETWFRAQSGPQKALLNPGPPRLVPLLVSAIHLIYFYASCAQQTLASLPGIYTLTAGLIGSVVDDLTGDGPLGHLLGHLGGPLSH